METETERLFIAVTLPQPVRDVLTTLEQPLTGVTWTRPEQLHLTLRFLGDVPVATLSAIEAHLATVKVAPFVLPLEGCGTFPPSAPPRVLWIGVGSGHPRLFQLRQRIDDALIAAGLWLDVRTFHPHATLARCRDESKNAVTRWVQAHREFIAPPFRVDAFDLYASELRPSGAVHTLRRRFPLAE